MNKSTITRERLQEIAEDGFLKHGESKELARIALDAMDSESWCLPLDYLQGHKDGLEWAAQLAEANHPETGDWLYDDPIELAKAISKGPDMPPSQPAMDSEAKESISFDEWSRKCALQITLCYPDFREKAQYIWDSARETQQPAPVVPPEQHWEELCRQHPDMSIGDAIIRAAWWNHCRAAMLQGAENTESRCGNSPVIPEGWTGNDKANAALMMLDRIETIDSVDDDRIDGIKRIVRELAAATTGIPIISDTWIPVGERMPEDEQEVLTRNRMGHRFVSFFDKHSGLFFDRIDAPAACSIEHVLVTHWMPLPAAPQEVKGE